MSLLAFRCSTHLVGRLAAVLSEAPLHAYCAAYVTSVIHNALDAIYVVFLAGGCTD